MTTSQNKAPIDKGMIVRTIVLFVALINQFLVLNGYSPIPFVEQEIEYVVTGAFTIAASTWAWWKNNNVRYKARRNEQYLKNEGLK